MGIQVDIIESEIMQNTLCILENSDYGKFESLKDESLD